MPDSALRVASFVPVGTEWMYALGLDEHLVGVTFECDVPERAKREHPVLVQSPHEGDLQHLTAGEIHALVADVSRDGHAHPLFALDRDALARAHPDVILTQTLCDVCAAGDPHMEEAAAVLGDDVLMTVGLSATRLAEVMEDGLAVAEAVGDPEAGERLVKRLAERVESVREAVAGRSRPRVAYLEWTDPPMTAGHWIPDVVDSAGGEEVLGKAGARSRVVDWDAVKDARPDVVLVAPCGFGTDRSAEEAVRVKARFPDARVVALDANRYLSRGGPNLATAVEVLAHVLHPDAWPKDPDASAWRDVGG